MLAWGCIGGLPRKKWLIDFEKNNSGNSKQTVLNFYSNLTFPEQTAEPVNANL